MGDGFWYKALRVDLDYGRITEEPIEKAWVRQYIGGAGLGTLYLQREVPPNVGAMDPRNRLLFTTGPFQASKLPGAAKFSIVSRSPLTGIFADSAAGAGWGVSFKKCGFDILILQGRNASPVYLYISDGKASLHPAHDLWGKDSFEAGSMLMRKYPGASVAVIGPAGENGVALANIYVDNFSAAGRCGLGAIMGSKNLKAVVVQGERDVPVFDREALTQLEKDFRKSIAKNAAFLRHDGTVGGLAPGEVSGNLPIRNWSEVGWKEGASKIGHPGYSDRLQPKPHACAYCSVGCHRTIELKRAGAAFRGPGPEYETVAMLGSNCVIDDLDWLVLANDYCNRMGIDTISAGSCAAFAMEALERQHSKGHQPGYRFGWGDKDGVMKFLEELTFKRGFGGMFSLGIKNALPFFEAQSADYACHVKGLDIPAHDPRVYYNLALSYATGNRGACHMRAYSQIATMGALLPEVGISIAPAPNTLVGAAEVVKVYQDFTSFYNSCVLCQFMIWGGFGLGDMAKVLNAITGWNSSPQNLMECGDRIFTAQRLLNTSYGIRRRDDVLPKRFFEPSSEGPRTGQVPEPFEESISALYTARGWDKNGVPTTDKLASLGIMQ